MSQDKSSSKPHVHQPNVFLRILLWVLSVFTRAWQRSLRFNPEGDALELLSEKSEPTLLLMWHNQLFSILELQRRFRKKANPLHALVSASKDGAALAYFLRVLGINPVRGSSSRRGMQAARELLAVLRSGGDVAITVDGPRGPIYKAQPGGAVLSVISGDRIAFVSCTCVRAWHLKSWDRFCLPIPFSEVKLKLKIFSSYEALGCGKDREAIQAKIEAELNALRCAD